MTIKKINWDEPDIGQEEIDAVIQTIQKGWVGSNGLNVELLEKEFAEKIGAEYVLAVNNGTSALLLSLMGIKLSLGKRKIRIGVPSFTFIATINSALCVSRELRFIDCSAFTFNISPLNIPKDIDVLLPVDVGGLPCDYDLFKNKGYSVVADSAESIGAKYKGEYIGTQADVHSFSLHRAKIITCGEGGLVSTNSKRTYEIMKSLMNHGYDFDKKPWEYKHKRFGLNFRMTELEASIARVQLAKLDYYVEKRRKIANFYKETLEQERSRGIISFQFGNKESYHPYFFFGIILNNEKNRDMFVEKMIESGITVKTWTACHEQEFLKRNKGVVRSNLAVSSYLSKRIVLLPIHNKLTEEDTIYVAEKSKEIMNVF